MAERDGRALWPVVAAFVIAVGAVCAAVFWPTPPTSLRTADPQYGGATRNVADARAATPYVLLGYRLCVAHGAVTIKSVAAREPARLKVVDWAAASTEAPPAQGDAGPGLAKRVKGFTQTAIDQPCAHPQQFAISVERTGTVGSADGFEVSSTSGTVVLPLPVRLCSGACPAGPAGQSGTP